ncbi:hypothetical protein BCR44DRAFT_349199 [Catenaria anguillulae PL171]|uniref:BHLH domain-containing protein n=1 Tax=Catenaria anguillulae PL171 TaxID=765915 RepID=A0A1Y2I6X3_9FUNG|nr:hypothetical protein BCR44DRAFT_349199 [Catenaria anguillulae PL171]
MYQPMNSSAGNFAHSHAHSLPSPLTFSTRSPRLPHPPPPPPPPQPPTSTSNANANANAPAFHVPVLSQRAPPPPASLLHLATPPNSSSSASSFAHSHTQSHSHTQPAATMPTAASATSSYAMPGPPPSPGLGSGDASWLTGGQDLFSGFLADDPAPGESLLTETEQKYFDMFLDWMATGTEPSHDAVEGMAAAANAAVVSASRHPTPDTSLPSPAATTHGSIKSVASAGGSGSQPSLQQVQYAHDQHQSQFSPPSMHSSLSSSFSARRHAPPPIQVPFGSGQQQQHHHLQPSSASRSASFSHHTPLTGPILSPTSTYLSTSDQPLESPYMPTSPASSYPTPLTHVHSQQPPTYPPLQPQPQNGANSSQPIQQLYALTPAGMVPVHVPTAALTAALEAQGMHTPPSTGEQHQQPGAAAHHVMYHPHHTHQQGQATLVLASPPPAGTSGPGLVQPGATLLQPAVAHAHAHQQSQQPNGQPMLVQLIPLASPSPSHSGGVLGLPSPTYQMYTLPSQHAHQPHNVPVMGTAASASGSGADAYATPAPSTPFGHAPHLAAGGSHTGRPRTLSTVSAMALDMGHLGLTTPTAPTHGQPAHAFLESSFFLHNHGHAQQHQSAATTVHAPSTTLSVAPVLSHSVVADVHMDQTRDHDTDQVHDFAIPAHAPTLESPTLSSTGAPVPAPVTATAKPANRKRSVAAPAASKPSTTAAAVPASRKRARPSPDTGSAGADTNKDAELKSTAAGSGKVAKRKPSKAAKACKPSASADTLTAAAAAAAAADGVPGNSHSEKRRRTLIRLGFQQLVDLVPELRETARVMAKPEASAAATAAGGDKVVGGHTVSKATILTKSFEYMRTVQRKIAKYEALVLQLEAYAARMDVPIPPGPAHEDGMDQDPQQPVVAHLIPALGSS